MKAFWKSLSGHKTIICSILFIILQSGLLASVLSPLWIDLLLAIVGALGGVSLIHHAKKIVAGEDK